MRLRTDSFHKLCQFANARGRAAQGGKIPLAPYTILGYINSAMAHTSKDKEKLLKRVRRIRGQVEAIERALESEQECGGVLQLMAACRGALNGLMAEVMEGHVRFHVLDPEKGKDSPQGQAAEELIDIVRAYLK
jgi:FrmR/RcnR family transcriptional regulator, repressor of frmRAB operon